MFFAEVEGVGVERPLLGGFGDGQVGGGKVEDEMGDGLFVVVVVVVVVGESEIGEGDVGFDVWWAFVGVDGWREVGE